MHKVDANEAKAGYYAVAEPKFGDACAGCEFYDATDHCETAVCSASMRKDGCNVIFKRIDYRPLLLKYIAHVVTCEGVDFIDTDDSCPVFTPEELAELRKLSKEANEMKPSGT